MTQTSPWAWVLVKISPRAIGNIDIGNQGNPGEANTIRIGTDGFHMATFIAGIQWGFSHRHASGCKRGAGQLGVAPLLPTFQGRDQDNGQGKRSDPLCSSRSHSATKKRLIPTASSGSASSLRMWKGCIRTLVARDNEGQPYSVRYDQVNAMLLNEFLKVHKSVAFSHLD